MIFDERAARWSVHLDGDAGASILCKPTNLKRLMAHHGAVYLQNDIDAVLLRQTETGGWIGLDTRGVLHHNVPSSVNIQRPFYEDTAFPFGIDELVAASDTRAIQEMDELACAMVPHKDQYTALIRETIRAAGDALNPSWQVSYATGVTHL